MYAGRFTVCFTTERLRCKVRAFDSGSGEVVDRTESARKQNIRVACAQCRDALVTVVTL